MMVETEYSHGGKHNSHQLKIIDVILYKTYESPLIKQANLSVSVPEEIKGL